MIWVLIGAGVACVILSLVLYTTWNYGRLNGLGFPVIPPFLIFGSNYMTPYRVQSELSSERRLKYGKIYGAYDGRTPVVYITDPTIARQIRTKDSESFRNHGIEVGTNPYAQELMDVLKDEKWKVVRSAITPIFTGGKIKGMSQIIRELGDSYAQELRLSSQNGKVENFSMNEFAPALVIESLSKALFGIQIPNARDPKNPFVQKGMKVLGDSITTETWLDVLFKMFPFLFNWFGLMDLDGLDFFVDVLKKSFEARLSIQSGEKVESHDAAGILAEMLLKVRQNDSEYREVGITETTVLAQGWELYVASYIGILDSLIALSYELALHPEIQEKMYQELRKNKNLDLAGKSTTPYTTAVVMEILRLYTQTDSPERLCNETWSWEGITIPKGTIVYFPISSIHLDPEYFPEPMDFRPERFLDKTQVDPNLFLAFGQGPRACPGKGFGTEVIRQLLISFVLKFQIVKRNDMEFVKKPGSVVTVAIKPVLVDLILRQ